MNYCSECHDTCQSIQLTKGMKGMGLKIEAKESGKDYILPGSIHENANVFN